jgi:hypothetical protein
MFHVKISSLIQVLLMNLQLLEDMRKQSTVDVSLQDVRFYLCTVPNWPACYSVCSLLP